MHISFSPSANARIPGLFHLIVLTLALAGCGKPPTAATPATVPSPGYNLISELGSTKTSLIDLEGRIVHQWQSQHKLGGSAYLLPDGRLVRCSLLDNNPFAALCPGMTGIMEIFDWDGKLTWSHVIGTEKVSLHHDVVALSNGNLLLIGVEKKNRDEMIETGRDPATIRNNEIWVDTVIEIKPTGTSGAEIVWEWRLWDHLVQDFDPTKKNFGVVSEHPDRIDVNALVENLAPPGSNTLSVLQSIGYVAGGQGARQAPSLPDWTHVNSISYHPKLDQIMLSVRALAEVWIIDHGTTTAEAATGVGGRVGKGGRLIYRWGNPQTYHRGAPGDQKLYGQHDAKWIAEGLPGAGNILILNNGDGRKGEEYTSVEEIKAPLQPDGSYKLDDASTFGPAAPVWTYEGKPRTSFFSRFLSGAERLPNGNTLACLGMSGELVEVNSTGETVWKWRYRVGSNSVLFGQPTPSGGQNAERAPPGGGPPGGGPPGGGSPGGGPPGGGPPGGGPPGGGPPPLPEIVGTHGLTSLEIALLMGPDLGMSTLMGGPPGGGGPNGPGGPPPGGGGPNGATGGGNGPPPVGGVFRAVRYAPDYPAFTGKTLKPASTAPSPPSR